MKRHYLLLLLPATLSFTRPRGSGCAGATADIPAIKKDKDYVYNPNGVLYTFEGAEVFYKHIRIQSITELPAEILTK